MFPLIVPGVLSIRLGYITQTACQCYALSRINPLSPETAILRGCSTSCSAQLPQSEAEWTAPALDFYWSRKVRQGADLMHHRGTWQNYNIRYDIHDMKLKGSLTWNEIIDWSCITSDLVDQLHSALKEMPLMNAIFKQKQVQDHLES